MMQYLSFQNLEPIRIEKRYDKLEFGVAELYLRSTTYRGQA
jgi:hypothetical protein